MAIDEAHEATDEELRQLENRIRRVYRQAYKDVEKTVKSYFKQFEEADEAQRALVADGSLSQTDYTNWRLTEIGRGSEYVVMRNTLAERYTRANEIAVDYVNNDMAKIYSLNRNYTVKNLTSQNSATKNLVYTMYDEATVKRLIVEQPNLMPHYPKAKAVARGIDLAYGQRQITKSVTSGILQGKSIPHIADDLMEHIDTMDRKSAIRTARTAVTEAENAGRQDASEYLEDKGCNITKRWIATADERTRPAHREADGQTVGLHEFFIVGGETLMYPGDNEHGASGWNLYNCRCSTADHVSGFTPTVE